ncbi:hypothetical protein BH23PLA1_BH23PLA1_09430 [soil metagenome]
MAKNRPHSLFDEDERPESASSASSAEEHRPFVEYLRTTPAEPLSSGLKAALWAVGALVGLLFLASLLKLAG